MQKYSLFYKNRGEPMVYPPDISILSKIYPFKNRSICSNFKKVLLSSTTKLLQYEYLLGQQSVTSIVIFFHAIFRLLSNYVLTRL